MASRRCESESTDAPRIGAMHVHDGNYSTRRSIDPSPAESESARSLGPLRLLETTGLQLCVVFGVLHCREKERKRDDPAALCRSFGEKSGYSPCPMFGYSPCQFSVQIHLKKCHFKFVPVNHHMDWKFLERRSTVHVLIWGWFKLSLALPKWMHLKIKQTFLVPKRGEVASAKPTAKQWHVAPICTRAI